MFKYIYKKDYLDDISTIPSKLMHLGSLLNRRKLKIKNFLIKSISERNRIE